MSDKNDVVIIELDRPRALRYGHKALKTLGAMTGKPLSRLMEDMKDMDFADIETILYCGLLSDAKSKGEDLQLEQMEDLLDQASSYKEITRSMTKAMSGAFGTQPSAPNTAKVKNAQRIAKKK